MSPWYPVEEVVPDPMPWDAWRPTVQEIADAMPLYTIGAIDDDREQSGAQQGTFNERTDPTGDAVERLIDSACEEVLGRTGVTIPERCYGLAASCAKWHVAMSISGSKTPANSDDASGEYRVHTAKYLDTLRDLQWQARMPTALRLI